MSSTSLKLRELESQVKPDRPWILQGGTGFDLELYSGRRCILLNDYQDKTLSCRDCGKEFAFTASEQAFYAEKGFANEPARCPDCRAKRKAASAGPREMHDITCSNCGKTDQVPFAPKGDRPVYCADCFKSQRAGVSA